MVWKLQAVEPDTCEGVAQGKGCRYIELWNPEDPPETRTHTVVSFDRVCDAHADDVVTDKMLWADGNWKPFDAYIDYQKSFFRHRNYVEWLEKHPDEPMPPEIAAFDQPLPTPGSVDPPPQAQIDAMSRVYGWNKRDNLMKGQAHGLAKREGIEIKEWHFEGHGDGRVLKVQVSAARERIQAALDIQHGPGRVTVE